MKSALGLLPIATCLWVITPLSALAEPSPASLSEAKTRIDLLEKRLKETEENRERARKQARGAYATADADYRKAEAQYKKDPTPEVVKRLKGAEDAFVEAAMRAYLYLDPKERTDLHKRL